jgi:hypothetical protein
LLISGPTHKYVSQEATVVVGSLERRSECGGRVGA